MAGHVDKPDCPLTNGTCAYNGMLVFLAVNTIVGSSVASLAGVNAHVSSLCQVCTLIDVSPTAISHAKSNLGGVKTLAAESRDLHKTA